MRNQHPIRHVQAALAVIERRGRCLICRRRPGGFLGGYWEFPGGKREPGESWTACVRRELREELGVRVMRVTPWMQVRRRGMERRPVLFAVFRCTIAGRPRPLAAEMLRWVPLTRLSRYRFPPANRPILERLTARRGFH